MIRYSPYYHIVLLDFFHSLIVEIILFIKKNYNKIVFFVLGLDIINQFEIFFHLNLYFYIPEKIF